MLKNISSRTGSINVPGKNILIHKTKESFRKEATLDLFFSFFFSLPFQRQIIEHLKLEGNRSKSNHKKKMEKKHYCAGKGRWEQQNEMNELVEKYPTAEKS